MNFPCLRGPHGAIFSYPVSRACHVNLPPAAYCADDLHAAIAHVSLPTCDPVFSPAVFRIRSAGCSTEASMMHLSCKLSSATATQAEIGPSRHRSAQIQAYSAYYCLHSARELTEIHPPTRNSTAQPGRCQPRHREAFLRLVRSQCMKGMRRQVSTVVVTEEHCREEL